MAVMIRAVERRAENVPLAAQAVLEAIAPSDCFPAVHSGEFHY